MLRKGDKVRIIGSCLIKDFTRGILEEDDLDSLPLVKLDSGAKTYIDDIYLFKENSLTYKLLKLFKRKKYAEYQRTHKDCNEV